MTAARLTRGALGAALATTVALPTMYCMPQTAHAAGTTLASDSFDRTTSGLGSGSTGAWTVVMGPETVKVADGQATFAGQPGQVLDASLPAPGSADVVVEQTITVPQLGKDDTTMVALTAREDVENNRSYRTWFRIHGNGRVGLSADRTGGGDTPLGGSAVVEDLARPGATLHLRMVVSGSNPVRIQGTVWADGTEQPGSQMTAVDSSERRVTTAGQAGMAMVAAQGAVPVQVKQFTASSLARVDVPDDRTVAPVPAPTATTSPTAKPSPTATATATKSPAPAPAPAPTVAATGSRGSLPVGQASYPNPAGAIFVATNGNDSNPGTQAAPKRNIQAAVDAAPAGGTVVIRGGVYNQPEVEIYKKVTIQNQASEAVWLDGSIPVTGWSQSGTTWRAPWTTFWDHSASHTKGKNDASFIDPANPLAAWPDQVFLDGKQLKQVSLGSGVKEGQFAVDPGNKQLVIGSNPSGHELRASNRDRQFTIGSPDVTLRGFGIRRHANAIWRLGVVFNARERVTVENVTIEDVAGVGITMTSDGKNGSGHIDHVTIRRTGLAGIGGNMFDNGKVTNSVITQNNTQGFNALPASAGIKVVSSRNVLFDNNDISENYRSTGIWTDESCVGITVTRNRIVNSDQSGWAGVLLELSSSGVVADNVVSGTRRGIALFDAEKVRVVNNTIWNSEIGDITVGQDARRQNIDQGLGQQDPRYPLGDPTNTWVAKENVINNNVFGRDSEFSNFQLYSLDKNKVFTAGQMIKQATGNAFEAQGTDSPVAVGWGRTDGQATQYKDIDEWSRAVGRGWVNKYYPANATPAEANKAAAGMTHGAPLDADIASKIGQSAGSKHIGSFQQP